MSFVVGTLTGGLVAGAIYYSFSYTIHTQTYKSRTRLHALAQELESPSIPQPLPASERITRPQFEDLLKKGWNDQVEGAVNQLRGITIDWERVWNKAKQVGGTIGGNEH
ncbi:hypothetical protein BOTBODRAFT_26107 [Botryobasidium botryosum FD-172 SS1]|uniref:MICOS complex subunit MIC12 n=1 Tax=Botryobasidium botryosum (strain FD-172 SS1) TaxID=930990 RepID=A0A067N3X8_BOTB1|nr:hypothetical protein BOTBODRAFT_26107 [Botryobasidium botryosum FD-172 SS1]